MRAAELEIPDRVRSVLLEWTRENLRDLPWRRTRDPWGILVAEMMLQQTQVKRVIDRWPRFLRDFPDPASCASRPVGDVVRAWQGLGYNRRAISLHGAATIVVAHHHGQVPREIDELLDLPGVGPYTARAVRSFAFEQPGAVVDTNVGRVLARLVGRSLTAREAQATADSLASAGSPWLWNQGIMEFGALECVKRRPACGQCCLASSCHWRGSGPDPADGSAPLSRPRSRFEGSDRQLRGRLVDVLRAGPVVRRDLEALLGVDCDRVERIVVSLVGDRLVAVAGDRVALP